MLTKRLVELEVFVTNVPLLHRLSELFGCEEICGQRDDRSVWLSTNTWRKRWWKCLVVNRYGTKR